jgi:hypothetical protein
VSSPRTPDDGRRERSDDQVAPSAPGEAKPKRRRATTPPPPGSDPTPLPEPPRGSGTENDERLKADKPPHY